jgi:hypothetical protein
MSKTRRRPTIILDAGYVSIRANDRWKSSKIIGLHGKKLFCIIVTVLILFFISCINLTVSQIVENKLRKTFLIRFSQCLIWIMYKLDWSPFYKNGSKVFRFDKINQQMELYHQVKFQEAIYTTKINDLSPVNIFSKEQVMIKNLRNMMRCFLLYIDGYLW